MPVYSLSATTVSESPPPASAPVPPDPPDVGLFEHDASAGKPTRVATPSAPWTNLRRSMELVMGIPPGKGPERESSAGWCRHQMKSTLLEDGQRLAGAGDTSRVDVGTHVPLLV